MIKEKIALFLSGEAKRKSISAFSIKLIGLFVTYLFNIIAANYYGKELFGKFVLAIGVLTVFAQLSTMGLSSLTVRLVSEYTILKKRFKLRQYIFKANSILLLSSIVALVIIQLFAEFLAVKFDTSPAFLRTVSFGLPFFVITKFINEGLRGLRKTSIYAFFNTAAVPLFFLFFLGISYISNSPILDDPVLHYILSIILSFILLLYLGIKYFFPFIKNVKDNQQLVSYSFILKSSIPLLFAQSMALVLDWTDQFMIGYYLGSVSVGVYFASVKMAILIITPVIAINTIVAPMLASFYSNGEMDKIKDITKKSGKFSVLISLPIFFLLFIFPDFFLLLFGDGFTEGKYVLRIMCVGQLVNSLTSSVGYVLEMTGKQVAFFKMMALGGLLNIILNLCLIPFFKLEGAAISTAFTYIFVNVGFLFYVWKFYGFVALPKCNLQWKKN